MSDQIVAVAAIDRHRSASYSPTILTLAPMMKDKTQILPLELLSEIFAYIPVPDVLRIKQVKGRLLMCEQLHRTQAILAGQPYLP